MTHRNHLPKRLSLQAPQWFDKALQKSRMGNTSRHADSRISYKALIGRNGIIPLPLGIVEWSPGTRIYWRITSMQRVVASTQPTGSLYAHRYQSSRVRRIGSDVHDRKPLARSQQAAIARHKQRVHHRIQQRKS